MKFKNSELIFDICIDLWINLFIRIKFRNVKQNKYNLNSVIIANAPTNFVVSINICMQFWQNCLFWELILSISLCYFTFLITSIIEFYFMAQLQNLWSYLFIYWLVWGFISISSWIFSNWTKRLTRLIFSILGTSATISEWVTVQSSNLLNLFHRMFQ